MSLYDPFENILYRVTNGKTNASPNRVTYSGLPTGARDYLRPNLGVFAQDQWTIRGVTVNAGLRFDYLRTGYPDHDIEPTQYVPVRRVFEGEDVIRWTSLSPRLGVSYDLFGKGKTAPLCSADLPAFAKAVAERSALHVKVAFTSRRAYRIDWLSKPFCRWSSR